ncbi:MAG: FtsQ-type POTRA domain-containing protein [Ardenticatenaceae bacterium]|nr:FtsQ-type POTRA domain-containing protein [Ardenticatenaceae bacterium]
MRRRPRRRSQRLEAYRATLPELTAPRQSRLTAAVLAAVLRWSRSHLAALALLVVLAGLGYWFFGTEDFYIYGAEITGTALTTPEEVYSSAQLEGLSIFWVNPPAIAHILEQNPVIQQAVVTTQFPNHVQIRVVEREPAAVWQSGDQSLFVDRAGVLFPLRGDASQAVVIRDLRGSPITPGKSVDPEAVLTALKLAELIPDRRAFDWEPGAGVSFITDGRWRVNFGDHSRLAIKVAAFRAFSEQVAPFRKVAVLDLSAPEQPYYREEP